MNLPQLLPLMVDYHSIAIQGSNISSVKTLARKPSRTQRFKYRANPAVSNIPTHPATPWTTKISFVSK